VLGRELYKDHPVLRMIEEWHDDHRLRLGLSHGCEGASELAGATDQYRLKPEASSCDRQTQVLYEGSAIRGCGRGRGENCDAAKVRNEFAEELHALASDLRIHSRNSCDTSTRPIQAIDSA